MNKPVPAHNIGGYIPMIDGPEKVSGRAKYTADILGAGQLAGRIYRSPYSHGEIVALDVSEALKLPGVKAIVTGADCDKGFGVLPIARTEYALARYKVRYRGEPVAAVAAVDDATAREALRRIKFTVKELPAYYTAKDALAPGAVPLHDKKPGNLERDVFFELGNVELEAIPELLSNFLGSVNRISLKNEDDLELVVTNPALGREILEAQH